MSWGHNILFWMPPKQTVETYGRVDGITNCVGSVLLKPAHLTSDDEWASTIAVNLTSAFTTVKAAARAMRRDGGSVVLTSSAAARVGIANHEAIAAAKGGIISLMRHLQPKQPQVQLCGSGVGAHAFHRENHE
jgi:NAD(P)-dependent dehydrogenase (short-subunit alcohol dehydrogenase family)